MKLNAKLIFTIVLLISSMFSTSAAAQQNVQATLLADIKQAQQTLQQTQTSIGRERSQLAKQLRSLQDKVIALREKTAVARRLADENTLGLSHLEKRLDGWRQQHHFQQNLLNRFSRQQHLTNGGSTDHRAILQLSAALQKALTPQWSQQPVVFQSGVIQQAKVLQLGPLSWFTVEDRAGLLASTDNGLKAVLEFEGAQKNGIIALQQSGEGELTFDPSNSKAVAMAQHQESAVEHVSKGGLWAMPILFFALFALVIAVAKSWQLLRLPKIQRYSSVKLQQLLAHTSAVAAVANTHGAQQALMQIAHSETNVGHRDDLLFNCLQSNKFSLERWLGAIAVVASIAPLLGLLGTVSGMIETFKMMTLFGSGDPEVVSGGIAQALITTELGLVVAIPALIINALLTRRAKIYYQQLESFALQISQLTAENIKPLHSAANATAAVEPVQKASA